MKARILYAICILLLAPLTGCTEYQAQAFAQGMQQTGANIRARNERSTPTYFSAHTSNYGSVKTGPNYSSSHTSGWVYN